MVTKVTKVTKMCNGKKRLSFNAFIICICYNCIYEKYERFEMLITPKTSSVRKKITTYRIDSLLLDEFREKCKKNGLVQVTIIENAMKQALEEMKEMEKENDR